MHLLHEQGQRVLPAGPQACPCTSPTPPRREEGSRQRPGDEANPGGSKVQAGGGLRGKLLIPTAARRRQRSTATVQADLRVMNQLLGYVDPSHPSFVVAVLTIAFNPLFWNVVARWEQKTHRLSKAFGSPYLACYALGAAILLLNLLRSHCFTEAMLQQPRMDSLDTAVVQHLGLALLAMGILFVVSSFLALGFTGTFLGDYFGILKEARVTTFPFNILDNPMYWGSTANYLGWALMQASPTGLVLTAVVALVYVVAVYYEEPFTAEIYRQKTARSHKRR